MPQVPGADPGLPPDPAPAGEAAAPVAAAPADHGEHRRGEHGSGSSHHHRRRNPWTRPFRRLRRRWRRLNRYERRRRVVTAVALLVVFLVVVFGLAALDALRAVRNAQSALDDARTSVNYLVSTRNQLLSTRGRTQAGRELAVVRADSAEASHDLTGSFGLSLLGVLPYLHTDRDAAVALAQDVGTTATTGQSLLGAVDTLVADSHGTSVDLPDLRRLDARLGTAVRTQSSLLAPAGGLLGSLANARQKFDTVDRRAIGLLAQGRQLVDYALPFLGADGPRTYLLAAENNAEMRDQGAVLSYAVMTTDDGTYRVTTAHSVGDVALSAPAPVPVPPGTQAVFGGYQPTLLWQSTNATADFPWSGMDMAAMYRQATGVRVDGVIGADVPMLRRLLALTGPVRVPQIPVAVSAANVVPVLLHALYTGLAPGANTAHADQVAAVFKAVVDRLHTGHVDLADLAETLAKGVAARDLMAWDGVPAYQRTITRFHGSGAIDTVDPTRTFHVAVENGTATKLDYYVHVDVAMDVYLTQGDHAVVDTAVTVVNDAPANAKPSYQLGPDGVSSTTPGQYVAHVYLWSPRDSDVEGGTPESGLVLSERDVSVLPRQQATVHFETVIARAVRGPGFQMEFVPQPRLTPEKLSVHVTSDPSVLVVGRTSVTTTIAKQMQLSFKVEG